MNKITIRPIKESELTVLVGLWVESDLHYKVKGRDSTANLKRQRKDDPDLFVGAFEGKRMVGAAIASDDGRKAWINRLAVLPEARRKGVASMLIRHCEDVLRQRGRHIFCVHIEHDNPESMRLFDKVGYRREDQIVYYTKRESDDY
jgi:ribosomal protein S18 acetylase RimI-like enzyme